MSFLRPAAAIVLASLLPSAALAGSGRIRDVGGGKRVLDFCVSIRFDATPAELANVERAFTDASAIVADATDGRYELGRISILDGSLGGREAEAFVFAPEGRAYATCGLYGTPGEHVTFYYGSNFVADPTPDGDAYTIAHELMHHVWGVKDEYSGPRGPAECEPLPGSPTASFCLLDNYFVRGGNDGFGTGTYTLNELCVASNHDPDLDTFEETQWGMSCWERLASHPTRSVEGPADLPDDDPPLATPPLFRYPTAERRFVVAIDRSSDESVAGDVRLGYERAAANIFIDLLPDGVELAVVSFAEQATVDFAIVPLDSAAREVAKDAIGALEAEGTTSIGAGLAAARDVLTAQTGVPCAQSIILLTDGLGNTGVDELSLVPSLIEAEISVVSIAVGTSASTANLQSIATDTGGRFLVLPGPDHFAPLVAALSADVVGGAANSEIEGTVAEGDTTDVQVIVDSLMQDVTIVLVWPDFQDDLELFLKTPSGRIITFLDALTDPDISFLQEDGSEVFVLEGAAVEDGIWSALVTGREVFDDGSFCLLTLHTIESAVMTGAPDRPGYDLSEAITLLATPRFGGNAVAGATVTGSFTRPDGTGGGIVLADDGLGPDDVAGDGVYTALFDDFQGVAGAYSFGFEVENVSGTTFGGEGHYSSVGAPIFSEPAPPFVRIASTSAVVAELNSAPLVTCTRLADAECDPEAAVHVEATVFDADGDALTVTWNVDGDDVAADQVPGGAPPTQAVVPFDWAFPGTGLHTITARVDDGGAPVSCATTVTIADGEPPSFSISLDRDVIWPPDGAFVTVRVDELALSDACDGEPAFELTTIRHDEEDEGTDVLGAEFGTPDTEFQLRAERDLDGDGREYTIVYTAFDAGGNATARALVVTVPRFLIEIDVFGDEGGFTPDGTDFAEDASRFYLVIPGDGASVPDPESAHVACPAGALRPLGALSQDLTGDGIEDVAFEFDAGPARELRDAAGGAALGFYWISTAGEVRGTPDIFALGPPIAFGPATDAAENGAAIGLLRPLPNPFRGTCTLGYSVPGAGAAVRIDVYDVQGRHVRQLADGVEAGGVREVAWDGRSAANRPVPAGVYFFRVAIGDAVRTLRVTLLR